MDQHLQSTNSPSFLNKLYRRGRQPAPAVFEQNGQTLPYCAVCLSDICGGHSYRKLAECGHSFHAQCIDAWLSSHSTCPLCRAQLPQIISLNENHYELAALISSFVLLFHSFLEKMCNPLNDELTSMLCDNISR